MNFFRPWAALWLLLGGASASWGSGLEGEWHGLLDVGLVKFRVALEMEAPRQGKIQGRFNNIDDGIYDQPFRGVGAPDGSFRFELPTGEKLELHLRQSTGRLEGTYTQAGGSFQTAGRISRLTLKRGKGFLVPRLGPDGRRLRRYAYRPPPDLSEGWAPGDLARSKADFGKIREGLQKVTEGTFPHIHGVLIVSGGKLLLDEYFYGYGPAEEHPIQSATKSVFSVLAGIAVDQGLIRLDDRLYDFFPSDGPQKGWQPEKEGITLRSLLTMTSGFACDDWKDSQSCSWAMIASPDWLHFCLSEPMDHKPGVHFAYCGACLTPFSELLSRQSGMSLPAFARKFLFDPLGIRRADWMVAPSGGPSAAGPGLTPVSFGLSLRPRDLAKVGYLYLKKGNWRGKQIVSEKWVEESTSPQVSANRIGGKADYGFLWWERVMAVQGRPVRMFYAWGVGGQYLFVVPDLDLVCVVTGGNYKDGKLGANAFRLFQDYLLPAFRSVGPGSRPGKTGRP